MLPTGTIFKDRRVTGSLKRVVMDLQELRTDQGARTQQQCCGNRPPWSGLAGILWELQGKAWSQVWRTLAVYRLSPEEPAECQGRNDREGEHWSGP